MEEKLRVGVAMEEGGFCSASVPIVVTCPPFLVGFCFETLAGEGSEAVCLGEPPLLPRLESLMDLCFAIGGLA